MIYVTALPGASSRGRSSAHAQPAAGQTIVSARRPRVIIAQIDGGECTAATGQAVTIAPGQRHRIINDGVLPIRFIVISQPSTSNDRYDL